MKRKSSKNCGPSSIEKMFTYKTFKPHQLFMQEGGGFDMQALGEMDTQEAAQKRTQDYLSVLRDIANKNVPKEQPDMYSKGGSYRKGIGHDPMSYYKEKKPSKSWSDLQKIFGTANSYIKSIDYKNNEGVDMNLYKFDDRMFGSGPLYDEVNAAWRTGKFSDDGNVDFSKWLPADDRVAPTTFRKGGQVKKYEPGGEPPDTPQTGPNADFSDAYINYSDYDPDWNDPVNYGMKGTSGSALSQFNQDAIARAYKNSVARAQKHDQVANIVSSNATEEEYQTYIQQLEFEHQLLGQLYADEGGTRIKISDTHDAWINGAGDFVIGPSRGELKASEKEKINSTLSQLSNTYKDLGMGSSQSMMIVDGVNLGGVNSEQLLESARVAQKLREQIIKEAAPSTVFGNENLRSEYIVADKDVFENVVETGDVGSLNNFYNDPSDYYEGSPSVIYVPQNMQVPSKDAPNPYTVQGGMLKDKTMSALESTMGMQILGGDMPDPYTRYTNGTYGLRTRQQEIDGVQGMVADFLLPAGRGRIAAEGVKASARSASSSAASQIVDDISPVYGGAKEIGTGSMPRIPQETNAVWNMPPASPRKLNPAANPGNPNLHIGTRGFRPVKGPGRRTVPAKDNPFTTVSKNRQAAIDINDPRHPGYNPSKNDFLMARPNRTPATQNRGVATGDAFDPINPIRPKGMPEGWSYGPRPTTAPGSPIDMSKAQEAVVRALAVSGNIENIIGYLERPDLYPDIDAFLTAEEKAAISEFRDYAEENDVPLETLIPEEEDELTEIDNEDDSDIGASATGDGKTGDGRSQVQYQPQGNKYGLVRRRDDEKTGFLRSLTGTQRKTKDFYFGYMDPNDNVPIHYVNIEREKAGLPPLPTGSSRQQIKQGINETNQAIANAQTVPTDPEEAAAIMAQKEMEYDVDDVRRSTYDLLDQEQDMELEEMDFVGPQRMRRMDMDEPIETTIARSTTPYGKQNDGSYRSSNRNVLENMIGAGGDNLNSGEITTDEDGTLIWTPYGEERIEVPTQKRGGQINPYLKHYMEKGGEYYLSDEEIEELQRMGVNIEYLD